MKLLITGWFCMSFFFVNAAQAIELADHQIVETIQVGNTPMKLNGAGIRIKKLFNVRIEYVAALYLQETKNTVQGIIEAGGPKQMNLTLIKDISSEYLRQAFKDVDRKNINLAERERLSTQFRRFDQLFLTIPQLKEGDVISMEWVPDKGTNILINGKKIGETFSDKGFFDALLLIWLGDKPVDVALKKQLLGGVSEATVQNYSGV